MRWLESNLMNCGCSIAAPGARGPLAPYLCFWSIVMQSLAPHDPDVTHSVSFKPISCTPGLQDGEAKLVPKQSYQTFRNRGTTVMRCVGRVATAFCLGSVVFGGAFLRGQTRTESTKQRVLEVRMSKSK